MLRHEACATRRLRQQQLATLTAHRLGDEKALGVRVVQAGGVELDELHVGHPTARTPGCCNAVARGRVRVGGVQVHLACATCGQDGVGCAERHHLVQRFVQCINAMTAWFNGPIRIRDLGVGDQVHKHVVFEHGDAGGGLHLGDEGGLDGSTRGIGRVDDAAVAVATFPGQMQFTMFSGEGHTQTLEPVDGFRGVFHDHLGGLQITQTCSSHQGVLNMVLKFVFLGHDGSNAALRPPAGTVAHFAFGEHRHTV